MEVALVADPRGYFPQGRAGHPLECQYAFFAGNELSDIEGWAFGADEQGSLLVWRVEGAVARRALGTFGEWLSGQITFLRSYVERLSREEIEQLREGNKGEDDPHRVMDYALAGARRPRLRPRAVLRR